LVDVRIKADEPEEARIEEKDMHEEIE